MKWHCSAFILSKNNVPELKQALTHIKTLVLEF